MKPYYSETWIDLYLGDAREILPELGKPDLIITYPPYGMDYQSAWRTDWQRKDKIQNDLEFPLWLFETKPSIAMFVCCRWDNLCSLPKPKSFIVWDKCRHSMGDLEHEFGRQWEAIAFYPGHEHRFLRRPIDLIRVPCVPPTRLSHPNEKPVELFTPLIQSHPGTVIDPFCGTGSVLRAAKDLGRKAIGIEIDQNYAELAVQRLRQEVLITA